MLREVSLVVGGGGGGGGGGAEERVAPRREEGEVEVRDVLEGGRDEVEVTRVAAERERCARLALQPVEAPRYQRQRVPRAGVGNRREHVQQNLLREMAHDAAVAHSPVRYFPIPTSLSISFYFHQNYKIKKKNLYFFLLNF